MPTTRQFARRAYQCGLYEAQDVLCQADDVDLICLQPRKGFELKQRWQRRLLYHDISRRLINVNPGLERVRLTQDYELFVAVCPTYWDLFYLNAIEGWKDRCKTSVLWLDEIWASLIPQYKYWLHALTQFDHIFVGCSGSARPLSEAIGRECRWLPGGVDTLRFTPYPDPPERAVDVYSIGRRCEGIHDALLRLVAKRNIFYVHDTFAGADMVLHDYEQHRNLLANIAKRTRYFVVSRAKIDAPAETQGQIEIGFRYYEGSAAGAILIGQTEDHESFRSMFGWPDAIIHVRPDGSDVCQVLSSLEAQPERRQEISCRNASEALMRHDWVYRWNEIFAAAGVAPSPGMKAREARLMTMAASIGTL